MKKLSRNSSIMWAMLVAVGSFAPAAIDAQVRSDFIANAGARAKHAGIKKFEKVCDFKGDPLAARILKEYGAVFVSSEYVKRPSQCIFENEEAVEAFQASAEFDESELSGTTIRLQKMAMAELKAAIAEARDKGIRITPRGGRIAGTRSYEDTSRLWLSRVIPGLAYWQGKGRITARQAKEIADLTPFEQVPRILAWEEKGIFFSTDKSRTILSSVAAPGTSQHLSGLALDVTEFGDAKVRAILASYGWFQTVAADEPHFTYMGAEECELPELGLISVSKSGYKFWVPSIP